MRNPITSSRPVAIVLGCGQVGSAVAFELHVAGFAVVLIDEADPAWHRRGMTFTNAWYVGNAELAGEGACFCASMRSISSVLANRMIAATTWSWPRVAGLLAPMGLIDARGRKRRGSDILLGRVPLTIGMGPNFVEGCDVDVAFELPDTRHGVDCAVEASRQGRFMTERRIGDAVRTGQSVGGLGNQVIVAPASGVLLGLAARGARIEPGDTLVEVDPAGIAFRCHGVDEDSRRVAAKVVHALATFAGSQVAPIQMERELVSSGRNTAARQ